MGQFFEPLLNTNVQDSAACLHEFNEVGTLSRLLHSSKDHLRPNDVFLRVDEVFEHVFVRPDNARVLISGGVGKPINRSRLTAQYAPKRGSLLRVTPLLNRVTLGALRFE